MGPNLMQAARKQFHEVRQIPGSDDGSLPIVLSSGMSVEMLGNQGTLGTEPVFPGSETRDGLPWGDPLSSCEWPLYPLGDGDAEEEGLTLQVLEGFEWPLMAGADTTRAGRGAWYSILRGCVHLSDQNQPRLAPGHFGDSR